MDKTNTPNLGNPTEEEQLDWVGDLPPTHLCIVPDAEEPKAAHTPPASFLPAQLHGSGLQLLTTYAQPISDLMSKPRQEEAL